MRPFLFIVDWLCDFEANIRTLGENHGIISPGPEDIVLKAGMGPVPSQDHLDGSFARTQAYEEEFLDASELWLHDLDMSPQVIDLVRYCVQRLIDNNQTLNK